MYNTYVCLVDNYRRPARQRNTQGRYLVGAKTGEDAKKELQQAIGFGSVQIYYKVQKETGTDKFVKPHEILKVTNVRSINNKIVCDYVKPRRATEPIQVIKPENEYEP